MKRILLGGLGCCFVVAMQAQVGKVGINTTAPAAMLHVKDSSVLFTGTYPLPISPGNPSVSGAGTRMMWYPDKAAFRVGNVTGTGATYWNKDSIGLYSVAMGQNTKAKGNYSIALGGESIASGIQSIAIGTLIKASGNYSTAMGNGPTASGYVSTAIGSSAIASGDFSTAIGASTIASGNQSTAMGISTTASGYHSTAMGNLTIASSEKSTAMGYGTKASGSYSISMGNLTNANGYTSTAMGYNTRAVGSYSTTFGRYTIAKPFASVVLGQYNDTSFINSLFWDLLDPVFIIGNGTDNSDRNNALTVLKNGNTGIGTISPQKLLHVSGGSSGATAATSAAAVLEDDSDVSLSLITPNSAESAIFFGNPSNAMHGGIVYNSTVANGFAFRTNGNSTKAVLTDVGNFGIGDNSPNARLHVSNGSGGNLYHSESDLILEDNGHSYIQFSTPAGSASGLLSGNPATVIRSAILFLADSTVVIRTGGNTTRLTIDKSGNSNTTGEIRRTSTGNANIVPISYGAVDANGTVLSGSGNFSVAPTPPGYYEVTITGETYTNSGYTATATAISSSARFLSTGNTGGKLVVRTFTSAAALVDCPFHFVVYKQ
ncbi:MAG TPA: hypothetical protein VI603_10635 [Saprospiraceae bacterium]|nr:hypothetical protein [Saprospiraceae bacterium]